MRTRQDAELRQIGKELHRAAIVCSRDPTPSTPPRTRWPCNFGTNFMGVPGEDEIAGHQLDPRGELRDDLGHALGRLGDVAVLAQLPIHLEPDAATRGMADVGSRRYRSNRCRVIEALGRVPGLALFFQAQLHVTAGQVVADSVAEYFTARRRSSRLRTRTRGAGPKIARGNGTAISFAMAPVGGLRKEKRRRAEVRCAYLRCMLRVIWFPTQKIRRTGNSAVVPATAKVRPGSSGDGMVIRPRGGYTNRKQETQP